MCKTHLRLLLLAGMRTEKEKENVYWFEQESKFTLPLLSLKFSHREKREALVYRERET